MSQPRAKGRRRRRLGTSWGSRSPEDTWLHRRRPGKAIVGEPTWTPRRAQASDSYLPLPLAESTWTHGARKPGKYSYLCTGQSRGEGSQSD